MTDATAPISITHWGDQRKEVFDRLLTATPVEIAHELKALARSLGVPYSAVKDDFQAYRGIGMPQQTASRNAATELVKLVIESGVALWKNPQREAFASIYVGTDAGQHVEHHEITAQSFESYLRELYRRHTGKVVRKQELADAMDQLTAIALESTDVYPVFNRIAVHKTDETIDAIYLDLCTPDWLVVEIRPHQWRVITSEEAPVRFIRNGYQKPLPVPVPSRDGLDRLLSVMNLSTARDRAVLKGWLIGTLHPSGPYPILILKGEKGSGKSTVAKMLKMLLDPTDAPLRKEPNDTRDLIISAIHTHILAFDNLSGIPRWFSDDLCRLSIGEGYATRGLYKDKKLVVFEAARPVLITGIALGTLRDDLADRSLVVELSRIDTAKRLTDDAVWEAFTTNHAAALGQLLTAASVSLANYSAVKQRLQTLPRMSVWAVWAEAGASVLGLAHGEVVQSYFGIQAEFEHDVVESDPVAHAIVRLWEGLNDGETVTYTTGELLKALETVMVGEERLTKSEMWPRTAQGLGKRLPRLLTALRSVGVAITSRRDDHTKTYVWCIARPAPHEYTVSATDQADQTVVDGSPSTPIVVLADQTAPQHAPLDRLLPQQTALNLAGTEIHRPAPTRRSPTTNTVTPTGDERRPALRPVRLDGDLYRDDDYDPAILADGDVMEF